MTFPGAFAPSVSLDLAGGFNTVIISTVIKTKPPNINSAVSSQTVSVSSSIDIAKQTKVDLQPEIRADSQESRVERHIHAIDDRSDHRADFAGIGRAAGLGRREGDDQPDYSAKQPKSHDVHCQPFHVTPAPKEYASDAQDADRNDKPAQEGIVPGEWLICNPGNPQPDNSSSADCLKNGKSREECDGG